jgi:tRNA threonylcarbamoyladenosine biosynthesis protein TsaE
VISLHSTSAEGTRAIGAALGRILVAGDVVLLAGDLGAGKTTLVQGVGQALGVEGPMPSPTFTLMNTYEAALHVAHIDLWRLERMSELHDLGLDELLDEGAVALVEWGDVALSVLGRDALLVRLEALDDEPGARTITIEPLGTSFTERLASLRSDT